MRVETDLKHQYILPPYGLSEWSNPNPPYKQENDILKKQVKKKGFVAYNVDSLTDSKYIDNFQNNGKIGKKV